MKLKNTSVVITGSASGLGAATASLLAKSGALVSLLDINIEAARKTASQIGATAFHCDVSDQASAATALAQVIKKNGIPRVLVNCAGIGPAARIVGKNGVMPLENFERVIRVNLTGSFNMMRLAAAEMMKEKIPGTEQGVILLTASVAAYEGQVGQAAYAASKGGIVSLTLPAAREFAQFGIRVNTIAPGIFETPLLQGLPEESKKSLEENIPFPKRLGQPGEFASLVKHLVDNPYINGEVIRIDGGLRMQPR